MRTEHEKVMEEHRGRLEKIEQALDASSPHFDRQKLELQRTNGEVRVSHAHRPPLPLLIGDWRLARSPNARPLLSRDVRVLCSLVRSCKSRRSDTSRVSRRSRRSCATFGGTC